MSYISKINLNDTLYDIVEKKCYGICTTEASMQNKIITCENFYLIVGNSIYITFEKTNTAENPTLNINNTGDIPIYYNGKAIDAKYLKQDHTYLFIYDGVHYNLIGHVEGGSCYGAYSHTEGQDTYATGIASHAEGSSTTVIGSASHVEGIHTFVNGYASHAEGKDTAIYADYGHAEGEKNEVYGKAGHAEGIETTVYGAAAHAAGLYTTADAEGQFVYGRYNTPDSTGRYVHIIGNGDPMSDAGWSNAHTVDWEGNAWYAGDIYLGGTSQDEGKKVVTIKNLEWTPSVLSESGGIITDIFDSRATQLDSLVFFACSIIVTAGAHGVELKLPLVEGEAIGSFIVQDANSGSSFSFINNQFDSLVEDTEYDLIISGYYFI